jgi:phenylpropionate dioxygenase-like ring-hydroxylating dioxygenase large terminal subunit
MWTPIALSRDIPNGSTRAVILDGRELVIWRAESGAARVWEDRCPHRGMRLSFGFVRGETLNCLYHGWQYGASGSCRKIPAHPDLTVPPTIRANAYASTETGGFIPRDPRCRARAAAGAARRLPDRQPCGRDDR